MATTTIAPPQITLPRRRFTVEEYHRMTEIGILREDERVELIEGEIVQMAAIGIRHLLSVSAFDDVLHNPVQQQGIISVQSPIRLSNDGEPQPDLAVLRRRSYTDLPTAEDVLLLVEVADSTIDYDRNTKFPLYAAAGIAEAWLADLRADKLERHTEPRDGIYTQIVIAGRNQTITSTRLPSVIFAVDTVLSGNKASSAEE